MLKNSTIILSTSGGSFQGIYSPCATSKTSSSRRRTPKLFARPSQQQHCRLYAMVSDGHIRHHHEQIPWPEVTSVNRIPTPYQIFGMRKGTPYSKQRFYELVKIYHPDRHKAELEDGIPHSTKLERYRLVVAANNLLSDPVRRGAYDAYGAGWNGQPEVAQPRGSSESGQNWDNYPGQGWGGGPRGPSQNATWEDWERWYQRDSKGKQSPLYFSNSAFVSLIVMFAALGGIGQATRVGNYSMTFIEKVDALHDDMSKELIRRRKECTSYSNREQRIQDFLRNRDPYTYGVTDPQGEQYRKLLPAPEVCSSGDIKQRDMRVYQERTPTKDPAPGVRSQ